MVNASPLILLGKTGHLDLLVALADTVVVPQAVATEVGAKPDGGPILAELTENAAYYVASTEPLFFSFFLLAAFCSLDAVAAAFFAGDVVGVGEQWRQFESAHQAVDDGGVEDVAGAEGVDQNVRAVRGGEDWLAAAR